MDDKLEPGRYIPADPRVVSRLLSHKGLHRSPLLNSAGFSVHRHSVEITVGRLRPNGAELLEQEVSRAMAALRTAGYLTLRQPSLDGTPGRIVHVYRRVVNDEHAWEFLRNPWRMVVTADGEAIRGEDDPVVATELAELEQAEAQRAAEQKAASEAVRARRETALERMRAAGFSSVRADWRLDAMIQISVDDAEGLLRLLHIEGHEQTEVAS